MSWYVAVPAAFAAMSLSSCLSLSSAMSSKSKMPPSKAPAPATTKTANAPALSAASTQKSPVAAPSGVASGKGALPEGSKDCPSWAAPPPSAATPSGIHPYGTIADPLIAASKDKKVDVAFYGDSITQLLSHELKDQLAPDLAKFGTVSINGIGGDIVEGVTWRSCQGLPDARLFVILVGTNNIAGTPPDEIGRRVGRLAALVRARRPNSDVLVLGIFWRVDEMAKVTQANGSTKNEVAKLDEKTHYADWGSALTADSLSDNVHPTADGWRKVLPSVLSFHKSLT